MQIKINLLAKELDLLNKEILILVDSREKENTHIIDYFNKNNISWSNTKFDHGDYSYTLKNPPKIEFAQEIKTIQPNWNFSDFLIERKSSLGELSTNFSKDRDRFQYELEQIHIRGVRLTLLVEHPSVLQALLDNDYDSDLSKEAFLGSLFSFINRYNINLIGCKKQNTGQIIYGLAKSHLKEILKY